MRWVWRAEAGAGKVEYGAVILVVAAVTAAVIGFGLPGDVRALLERSMCLVPGDQECEEVAAGDPGEESEDGGDDSGEGDEDGEPGDGGEGGGSEDGDEESGDEGDQGDGSEYDPEAARALVDTESELEDAEEELEEAQSDFDDIKDELLQLLKELIGLQDAEDCLTEGDIVACIWTVVGFAPWGKAAKVAKKIPAIARLVTKWRRRSGRLDDAEDAASTARGNRDEALEACGAGGGRNSFPAGTPVLLADGDTEAIEYIERFDDVLASDAESGLTEGRPVTATMTTVGQKDLVIVTVLTDSGGEQITATDHHRFWVDSDQEWVPASDLAPGDQLRTSEDGTVTVASLGEFTQRQTVYNLTVHDLHTYYVSTGSTGILVHNQNNGDVGPECSIPGPDADDPFPGRSPDAPEPLNRGSTGRAEPENLREQVAMEDAMSNPESGKNIPPPMTDPRWPKEDGWVKMQKNVNGTIIHYVRNTKTGEVDDYKFK